MGYLSESRGFLSPGRWVTFLSGCKCRGRGRSVSRLQIGTSRLLLLLPQGPGGGLGKGLLCHLIWLLDASMALDFGRCWRRASVRRGAVPGHQPCCPQGLSGRGNKLQAASLPNLFREKTAICGNGERKRCYSWRSSACVTSREHHGCPTEQC